MSSKPDFSLPPPDPDAAAHSHRLAEHIANEIGEAEGWIPFTRYMELALYTPGLGYYAAGARKIGPDGDFITAPELSPAFASCLSMQARQVLEHTGGDILEIGPGTGRLAADLYGYLKKQGAAPARYRLLEVSPDLRARQQARIASRHPEDASRFEWIDRLPERIDGLVIANEVLDVLPFALVHRTAREIVERGVVVTEAGFAWEDMALPEGDLKRRAHAVLLPGDYDYLTEVNFSAEGLVRSVSAALGRGLALFIDYGFAQSEYYHPQRAEGTLRCHYRHRVHNDPFFLPGLQDMTAHVDFTAMALAAQSAGAEVMGYTTQAHFLISCGLAVIISGGDPEMTISRLQVNSAVRRLIEPSDMGELFKVLGVGRGLDTPLQGFQSARPLSLGIGE